MVDVETQHLLEELCLLLTPSAVAYAVRGAHEPTVVEQWRDCDDPTMPDEDELERLQAAYKGCLQVAEHDGLSSVMPWFMGHNLSDEVRSPAGELSVDNFEAFWREVGQILGTTE